MRRSARRWTGYSNPGGVDSAGPLPAVRHHDPTDCTIRYRQLAAATVTGPRTVFGVTRNAVPQSFSLASSAAASATLAVATAALVRAAGFGTRTSASSSAVNATTGRPSSAAAADIPGSPARRSIVARARTFLLPTTSRTARRISAAAVAGRHPTPTTTSPLPGPDSHIGGQSGVTRCGSNESGDRHGVPGGMSM